MGLIGCNDAHLLDRIAPETAKEARTNFDYLRHQQFDRIEPSLDPSIDRITLPNALAKMAAVVPAGEPISVKTVGAHVAWDSRKGTNTSVVLEYEFPSNKWILVEMLVYSKAEESAITYFHVEQEPASLEDLNRFTLIGKEPVQYVILGAAIGVAGLMIYALVLCIRTPMAKHKWLWIILIFLGVAKIGVNWTTGETFYRIIYLFIPAATAGKDLYGPWSISISLPVGALLFLTYREKLRKREAADPTPVDLNDAGYSGLHPPPPQG